MDTIYALASARGKAGVAVVRVSGPAAPEVLERMAGPVPQPRVMALRRLTWQGVLLDEALVVLFAHGGSFTGEDVVELHLHGGMATVSAVLRALSEQPGLRLAEPGEFTRRALENGVLDLTQVEGLADLIDSETEVQRQQAFRVLSGAVGKRAEAWRRDILRAAALLEASIDFADEDVPVDVLPEVRLLVAGLLRVLTNELAGSRSAERIRDGFEIAIVGSPNVGKSTLLNAIAGREAAITSDIAGTTRDVIEVRVDLDGLAVTFLDMAGLRETDDGLERMGVDRARQRAAKADLRVFLLERGEDPLLSPETDDLLVEAKADLAEGAGLRVSGRTGLGVDSLLSAISGILHQRAVGSALLIRERQRLAVREAISDLVTAQDGMKAEVILSEVVAGDLRFAARALDSLIGRLDNEHVLGEIFSRFCIGK